MDNYTRRNIDETHNEKYYRTYSLFTLPSLSDGISNKQFYAYICREDKYKNNGRPSFLVSSRKEETEVGVSGTKKLK
jgi:hypothetical protein